MVILHCEEFLILELYISIAQIKHNKQSNVLYNTSKYVTTKYHKFCQRIVGIILGIMFSYKQVSF